ncbi:MAG: hypothetical protein ACYS7Y_11710 [Planctomycetota bacterium]|jgi:hypothetical protein
MKVVAYENLLESAMGIQPHIAWLLSQYLSNKVFYTDDKQAGNVLKDLQLRFSKLHGAILQMEADATEIDVEESAAVFVYTTDDAQGWDNAVEALRDALAETIVGAGEYKLEKEAKLVEEYGMITGSGTTPPRSGLDYWMIKLAEEVDQIEALEVLKAVCREYERQFVGCSNCASECTSEGCLYEDDIPHIDADGVPFEDDGGGCLPGDHPI